MTKYKFSPEIISVLVKKYGFTEQYIRQCINGHRNNLNADAIKKDYYALKKELDQILNTFLNNNNI